MAKSDRARQRFKRIMRALPAEIRKRYQVEMLAAVAPIVAEQKARAPVYQGPPRKGETPGELRDSIHATTGDRDPSMYAKVRSRAREKDPGLTVMIVAGAPAQGTTRSDAHLREFGTSTQAPQPFFFGPVRAHRERVSRRIRRLARAAIKDALKSAGVPGVTLG